MGVKGVDPRRLTRSGVWEGGEFLDKAKGLSAVAAWGVPEAEPPDAGEILKFLKLKTNEKLQF